jgi:hypothetical protein
VRIPTAVSKPFFERKTDMSKLYTKSVLTVLTLAVIIGLVPTAFGATKVIIAGSSALFNTVALGAYNNGSGPTGAVAPTFHWSFSNSNLVLQDTRVTPNNNDAAKVWVVWDSSTAAGGPNVWIYANVDSVVGNRCFFAVPACKLVDISGTNAEWTATATQLVSSSFWGADTPTLPSNVLSIVENAANMAVNVAATDIRPEDAWFAVNRVNSALGASTAGGSNSDGLDGLGYNANNAAGIAPNYVTSTTGACTPLTSAKAVGTQIYSAFQKTGTSTDAANVLAFNILGKDPISCTAIPTYSVSSIGAAPIVFVFSRTAKLAGLANATEQQLQRVFSGTETDASAFGLAAGSINAFLREPLSGTMNTTEATVFRYPTLYSSNSALAQNVAGLSQETGVGTPTAGGTNNPLGKAAAGGSGFRFRAIGTGEEVNSVLCSNTSAPSACASKFSNTLSNADGIGYAFYSYGNIKNLADSANYGYITLNGVDPIFTSYQGIGDPGQPLPSNYGGKLGVLPLSTENGLLATGSCENQIWKYGYSFPNVRNGSYRAWSVLRLAYGAAQKTNVTNLIRASNVYAVTTTPDYIPSFKIVTPTNTTCGAAAYTDPGLLVWRSHYQQLDGLDRNLGKAPVNTNTADVGGDMGGAILIYEVSSLGIADKTTQLVQSGTQSTNPTGSNLSPALRPAN